ncbi:MAG: DUF1015 family protein [Oscillospiraceae bacterium]|nr:DUF1015 family protein [Oscillospiraceae bacterium]
MATVKPFRAVRPARDYAERVAALPYDVMGSDEAREMVKGNPCSFLHVDKAEIDLDPSVDLYDAKVYAKAKENLDRLVADSVLVEDKAPCFYIYRLTMDGRDQEGLVICASIDDYLNGAIKKHEFTRADKEADRIRHVDTLDANTGPIFLTCPPNGDFSGLMRDWAASHKAVYDFVSEDGIGHKVWVIDDPAAISSIEKLFDKVPGLYIADGHHRCASAVRVGERRRAAAPDYTGEEEFNFFLAVVFPSDQLKIMDYNRLVKDLNGNDSAGFMDKLSAIFTIEPYLGEGQMRPGEKHSFGMYLDGKWYKLTAKPESYDAGDPVGRLDVSILQTKVLEPILGIADPRTDKRVDFVGGIRGLAELERRVADGWRVAFSMFPTTLEDLMDIADAGMIMPPKSTWFEPKLRSGLFIHKLS